MPRISERSRYELAQSRVGRARTMNTKMLDQLSTQKRINKLSDDPIGSSQVVRYKDKLQSLDQYKKNIEFSKGFLERSESAIGSISESLIRAKELAIAMSSDTYNAASRNATAEEVKEILDDLVQLGNSTFNGRFIFGGFRNQTPPLSLDGDFVGDDGALYLQISPKSFRQVNLQSRYLFEASPEEQQSGHFNMVHAIEMLYHGLRGNDKAGIQRATSELEFQLDKTTTYRAKIGSMWNSLNQSQGRLEKEKDLTTLNLTLVEDADFYEATSDFKRTETVLQSTLMATNKLLQPSLLNFMQ